MAAPGRDRRSEQGASRAHSSPVSCEQGAGLEASLSLVLIWKEREKEGEKCSSVITKNC